MKKKKKIKEKMRWQLLSTVMLLTQKPLKIRSMYIVKFWAGMERKTTRVGLLRAAHLVLQAEN